MLKNFTPRRHSTETEHSLIFFYDENGGFAFPCDASGHVAISELSDCAFENLVDCMTNPERFEIYGEVRTESRRITFPAHGTCKCGNEVYLYDQYMGACECEECGQWYNLFGQELLPPESWKDDGREEIYW